MAHPEQQAYVATVKNFFPKYFENCTVLEIGSYNINGTVRDFFINCNYLGIDLAPGPGVDLVCAGQEFNAPSNMYDTVISTECFEHNPYWKETFLNMIRVCRPGGLVIFTCAGRNRVEHGTARMNPQSSPFTISNGWENYYMNLEERHFLYAGINCEQYFWAHKFYENSNYQPAEPIGAVDLCFWGIKKV